MELIDLVGSVIKTLVRWLTFPLGSQTVVHTVLFFWMYLFLLMPVFCCAMPLCLLGNSDHVLVSVFIDFIWNTHQNASFYTKLMTIAILIGMLWDSLHDHLRDVPWEDIIKLSASTAIVTYIVTRSQYVPLSPYTLLSVADIEVSWWLPPSLVSLLSDRTVQPENTYSCILKVTGQVWESQKRISNNNYDSYHRYSSP